jgi:uncharacterized protein
MPRPVALITGPTCGIGAGYARRYARDGYDLALVARDVERLKKLATELDGPGRNIEVLPADLADPADRRKIADRVAEGVRVLVNNAGIGTPGDFLSADPALLQGTGVGVHAVCPGFTQTEFFARAGMEKPKLPPFLWLGVDAVVSMSLADIARGKVISVPGVPYKAIAGAGRMTPQGLALAVTKRVGGHGRT